MLGLPLSEQLSGRSFAGLLTEATHDTAPSPAPHEPADVLFVQQHQRPWGVLASIDGERYKLTVHDAGVPELFNLNTDPAGLSNVAAANPGVRDRLVDLAREIAREGRREAAPRAASAEEIKRLRSLGYLNEVQGEYR